MQTFVVECYWPGIIEDDARATLDLVVRLSEEALPGEGVRLLGCIVVPSDGMALFLFHAPSESMVNDISRWAEVPFDRIVQSVYIGWCYRPGVPRPGGW